MKTSRRDFLGLMGRAGAAFAASRGLAESEEKGTGLPKPLRHDPNLTALISDSHVNGQPDIENGSFQKGKFMEVVAEILRCDPLPAHVLFFGDLAYLWGNKKDYEACAPVLKLLEDAGVAVTLGMGNHDRRSTFLEVFPEYAKRTRVPGNIVTVTEAGPVDFIMLDSLQGTDDRGPRSSGPGGGLLSGLQQEWLRDALAKLKKPTFVCAHHPVGELSVCGVRLLRTLMDTPRVAGYLHGHDHKWYTTYKWKSWTNPSILKALCLPSTGHWGDIGWAGMRVKNGAATVSLHQSDYFFPSPEPTEPGVNRALWAANVADNQGLKCTFPLSAG
ncbi:MAG: metallophosphoesterase [Kiritimatiellae bacterium]|nr:metallophosphoesterase [Kiritimatiellia bacterium]